MNKTSLALIIGAIFVSSVVTARSDFRTGSSEIAKPVALAAPIQAAPVQPAPVQSVAPVQATYTPPAPIVVAQAEAAAPAAALPAARTGVAYQGQAPGSPESVYMQDQQAVSRINAQIDAIMQQPNGGFAVTYYSKAAPPPPSPYDQRNGRFGQSQYGQDAYGRPLGPDGQPVMPQLQPGMVFRDRSGHVEKYVIARPGDTVYATLDRAFNSDDPAAPIFATIRDVDGAGIQGPLDGVRMIGNIVYSNSQGAIQFQMAYLPDGRPVQVKGIAISEDDARTGVAKGVDNHEIERYGSLLVATLAQGAGQVGQILLQNNQQATVDPTTGFLVSSQKISPYQAALAGLLPAGQALTAVAAQNFNKPATITGPAGMGLGIVFTEPVVLPGDVLFARVR